MSVRVIFAAAVAKIRLQKTIQACTGFEPMTRLRYHCSVLPTKLTSQLGTGLFVVTLLNRNPLINQRSVFFVSSVVSTPRVHFCNWPRRGNVSTCHLFKLSLKPSVSFSINVIIRHDQVNNNLPQYFPLASTIHLSLRLKRKSNFFKNSRWHPS